MMTNEEKIKAAARLLIRLHGSQAIAIAEIKAEHFLRAGDKLMYVVWCWIAESTAELLRPLPKAGERVH